MRCTLLLFAQLAELTGRRSIALELAPGATVADAWEAINAAEPSAAAALTPWRQRVAVAVNHRYATDATRLAPGDEIALLPPVSGG